MSSRGSYPSKAIGRLASREGRWSRAALFAVPIVGVLLGESLLYLGSAWYALWAHVGALGACIAASVYRREAAGTYRALSLLPVFRLVNLGMPVFTGRTLAWLSLIYAVLLPAIHFAWRDNEAVGLPVGGWIGVVILPGAIIFGAFVGEVGRGIVALPTLIAGDPPVCIAYLNFATLAFVGCVEELVFRGILQDALVDAIGRWRGILLASVLFGAMYSVYATLAAVGFGITFGLLLGIAYHWTRSLLVTMALHATANLLLFAGPAYPSFFSV